jgi:hypothetical protein
VPGATGYPRSGNHSIGVKRSWRLPNSSAIVAALGLDGDAPGEAIRLPQSHRLAVGFDLGSNALLS